MDTGSLYKEFTVMVETGYDLNHMIRFMDFINKCIKSNKILNEDDEGVNDCDTYYITACCTQNLNFINNPNALGKNVHDYYYIKAVNDYFIITSCQLNVIEMLVEFINFCGNNYFCVPYSNIISITNIIIK